MNTLLLFFAFPIATIILSIILQENLKNPVLVASTFFAIYLVIAFAFFNSDFLIFVIVYTILAYITAIIVQAICKLIKKCFKNCLSCNNHCNDTNDAIDNCVCCNLENINNSLENINDSLNNENNNINNNNNNNSCQCNRSYGYMPRTVNRRYRM